MLLDESTISIVRSDQSCNWRRQIAIILGFTVSHDLLRVYIILHKFKYKMGIVSEIIVNQAEANHKTHLLTLYSWIWTQIPMNLQNWAHAHNGPRDSAMLGWEAMLETEGQHPTLFAPKGQFSQNCWDPKELLLLHFKNDSVFSMWLSQGYTQAVSNTESEINNKRYI